MTSAPIRTHLGLFHHIRIRICSTWLSKMWLHTD